MLELSFRGKQYFAISVDDATWKVCVYPIQCKDGMFDELKNSWRWSIE